MAYDPNDPEDKKIVSKLVKEAVTAALAEVGTEHEQDIQGLKDKNKELITKLAKASTGENNAAELATLEEAIAANKITIKDLTKQVKEAQKTITEGAENLKTETSFNRTLLVDNGLTEALVKANVAPQFLPAVKSLLSGKVEIKTDGDKRIAVVDGKPLGDFITAWSQGDDGKHYIGANVNTGSGADGNKVPKTQTGKTMTRAAYDALPPIQASAFFAEGGSLTE